MTLWQRIVTFLALAVVATIAAKFVQDGDWRNRLLGAIVIFVYILIGGRYATRLAR